MMLTVTLWEPLQDAVPADINLMVWQIYTTWETNESPYPPANGQVVQESP